MQDFAYSKISKFFEKERERVEKMEVESGASRGRRVNELETHLSLYTTPPDQSVSLEEFENFA